VVLGIQMSIWKALSLVPGDLQIFSCQPFIDDEVKGQEYSIQKVKDDIYQVFK
jgi:hypothetical protein